MGYLKDDAANLEPFMILITGTSDRIVFDVAAILAE
jgi:hypothetical protein